MERVKQLEDGINSLIGMIDVATEDIFRDCAEKGGFIPPLLYGKLCVYENVRRQLQDILEGEDE